MLNMACNMPVKIHHTSQGNHSADNSEYSEVKVKKCFNLYTHSLSNCCVNKIHS